MQELSTKRSCIGYNGGGICNKIISIMAKPIEIQYSYKKQIGFTQQQKKAFETMERCNVNVNQFIRTAINEKIQRDWKQIKIDNNETTPF